MTDGYIKLSRKLLDWEWYKDANTMRVWIHLLLLANWTDGKFQGEEIPRGSIVCSYGKLAEELGLTYKQVRTAIKHLIGADQVAIIRKRNFLILSVLRYGDYQAEGRPSGNQRAIKGQSKGNNIRINKNIKNKKNAFGGLSHREYDFDEMERGLLNGISQISLKEGNY